MISDHGRFWRNGRFWTIVGEQKIDKKKWKYKRSKNSETKMEEEVEYDLGTVYQYQRSFVQITGLRL